MVNHFELEELADAFAKSVIEVTGGDECETQSDETQDATESIQSHHIDKHDMADSHRKESQATESVTTIF